MQKLPPSQKRGIGLLDTPRSRASRTIFHISAETEVPAEEKRQGKEEQGNWALQEYAVVIAVHQDGLAQRELEVIAENKADHKANNGESALPH